MMRAHRENYRLRVVGEPVVHEVIPVLGDDSDITLCGIETVQLHRDACARLIRRMHGRETLFVVEDEPTCLECIAHHGCACMMHL